MSLRDVEVVGGEAGALGVNKLLHMAPVPACDRPQRCPSCPFGGVTVDTRGPEDSPFVIVGESPGATELHLGRPFSGPSGQMIEEVLKQVGYTKELIGDAYKEPYILNAMQCLPRNKNEGDRLAQGTMACAGRLHEQIAKHPRTMILALGAAAQWSITGNYGLKITRDRGKLWSTPLAKVGCVTTFHPAYLMRNGNMYQTWKRDIQYAVDFLKGHDNKAGLWAIPMWSTIETRDQLEACMVRYRRSTIITGDIETGGSNGAGLHFQKGYIISLGVTSDDSGGRHVDIIPGKVIWENEDLMQELLGLQHVKWVWQNGKFDVKFFRYEGLTNARVDEDTMLMSYSLNENKGHDLDTLAWDFLGAPNHKAAVDDWFKEKRIAKANKDYGLLPKDLLFKYQAYDVSKTHFLYYRLRELVNADAHTKKLYERILIPASEFLTQIEMKGLQLNHDKVTENLIYLEDQIKEPMEKVQSYAKQYMGHEINLNSPKQLGELLYQRMKLGTVGSSTNEDALIMIQRRHDHPICNPLMRIRRINKAKGTYVAKAHTWPGLDGRFHVTYKLHATTTGRLSSSDPTNAQNWPRDPRIRGQVQAEEGKVLVECDLNQAELRCLAIMSGDPTLLEIYTKNEVSIHHITSVAMFGEKYDEDQKMRAKAINFGIVYGRTAPSIAEEFDITVKEAEEYIRIWLARYPKARDFIQESRKAPSHQRTMITTFGRKKRWGIVSYDKVHDYENEAANFPHQSTAHDITLLAGIETQPVIRQLWNAEFVNEIHDALYFEIADDPNIYGPAIAYVQRVMRRVPIDWGLTRVPFLAEAKVGRRWGSGKAAKGAGLPNYEEFMFDFSPTDEHRHMMVNKLYPHLTQNRLAVLPKENWS